MKRFIQILLLLTLPSIGVFSQDLKGLSELRIMSGLMKIDQLPVSNNYFGLEYSSMIPGSLVNVGFKYYGGFTTRKSFEFESYNSDGYYLAYAHRNNEMSVNYFHYGIGITANKFIIGNYFDGGLFVNLELSGDMFHTFGDNNYTIIDVVADSSSSGKNYDQYICEEGHFAINIGGKIGYSIPLSNMNIGVFMHMDHSIYGVRFDSHYDEKDLRIKRHYIALGLCFSFFNNNNYRSIYN